MKNQKIDFDAMKELDDDVLFQLESVIVIAADDLREKIRETNTIAELEYIIEEANQYLKLAECFDEVVKETIVCDSNRAIAFAKLVIKNRSQN